MTTAYICESAHFLPNEPVGNDDMERVLGVVGSRPARERNLVLRKNGIKQRYYALDPNSGEITHSNAELTAAAVRQLAKQAGVSLADVDVLACGTSSPDQMAPGHGVMVHGELSDMGPCEVVSPAGICCAGVGSLRYAAMAVMSGQAKSAVATGSEVASSYMRSGQFSPEYDARAERMESEPELAFDGVFLRWMLSDGAGALLLADQPAKKGISLAIEWIDLRSYAHEQPVCMYAGGDKSEGGRLRGWREAASPLEAAQSGALTFRQDVRQLNEHVIHLTVEKALQGVLERHPLDAADVDWFLPHYSSEYFHEKVDAGMRKVGFSIPQERWFTNLGQVGNIGSASFYLLLDGLRRSGQLKAGQKVLCYVPESGRFSSAWILLRAVEAGGE